MYSTKLYAVLEVRDAYDSTAESRLDNIYKSDTRVCFVNDGNSGNSYPRAYDEVKDNPEYQLTPNPKLQDLHFYMEGIGWQTTFENVIDFYKRICGYEIIDILYND